MNKAARRRRPAQPPVSKTMSVRMDRDNYEFLHEITKEDGSDLSKAVRELVTRGRILLAVERYKKGEASLGRGAELAGVPVGQMMRLAGARTIAEMSKRYLSA